VKRLAMILLVICACGGKSTGPVAPAPKALPDVPFDQLDEAQQHQFMKEVVVPAMQPLFQQHDAKRYAEFGCKTCHGPGVEKHQFDMPNAELPKLNFSDMSKFKKDDLEWMGKDIMPTMAKLLKQQPYSEENPKGFGCLACHTQEGAPPPSK
jgi:cytochrome c553